DAIDAALHHRGQGVVGPRPLRLDAADDHAEILAPGLLLRPGEDAAQVAVAEIARDPSDRLRPLHPEAASPQVGDVAEVAGGLEDARPRQLGNRPAAVQDLARGLEAHARASRHVLDRDMPGLALPQAPGIMRVGKRTFA